MNADIRNCLLLLSACTNGRDSELTGIVKAAAENRRLYQIQSCLDSYYFLSSKALELRQQIAEFPVGYGDFPQSLELWRMAEEIMGRFDHMYAKEFTAGVHYHIIHKSNYPDLMQKAQSYLGDKLYEVICFASPDILKALVLPPSEDINKVVDYTDKILKICSVGKEGQNITNLSRENVMAVFQADIITELTVEMVDLDDILELSSRNLTAIFGSSLFCISEQNYNDVLNYFIRNKTIVEQGVRRSVYREHDRNLLAALAVFIFTTWCISQEYFRLIPVVLGAIVVGYLGYRLSRWWR